MILPESLLRLKHSRGTLSTFQTWQSGIVILAWALAKEAVLAIFFIKKCIHVYDVSTFFINDTDDFFKWRCILSACIFNARVKISPMPLVLPSVGIFTISKLWINCTFWKAATMYSCINSYKNSYFADLFANLKKSWHLSKWYGRLFPRTLILSASGITLTFVKLM